MGVYHSGALPQGVIGSSYIDDPSITGEETKFADQVTLVVQNLGQGYQIGDRFTVLGSDCQLQVSEVGTFTVYGSGVSFPGGSQLITTYNNAVKKLTVLDVGTYFDHHTFMPVFEDETLVAKKPIHSFSQGAAKIEPLNSSSTTGKGFQAYVVRGEVRSLRGTDDKPKIATDEDYYQLSLPASHVDKMSREHDQMVVGTRNVKANIDQDEASPDGMYDLFFHFHNDISHTWFSKQDWGMFANNEDQYIELDITPV